VNGEKHLIVASDHNKGCFVPVEMDVDYPDISYIAANIHRFIELELPEAEGFDPHDCSPLVAHAC